MSDFDLTAALAREKIPVVTRKWHRDPVCMVVDGVPQPTEYECITCTDVRNTLIGPIDFGWTIITNRRLVQA